MGHGSNSGGNLRPFFQKHFPGGRIAFTRDAGCFERFCQIKAPEISGYPKRKFPDKVPDLYNFASKIKNL
ncbi:MAG: hypothetical protein D6714_09345 [Bacteroidetes bacterium]|nr:MAG: hypothetical protein D6714_09345 [Bacteroidota bacterium]